MMIFTFQTILQKFSRNEELDSDFGFSFGNLFRCICCPKPKVDVNEKKFEMVLEKLETIERAVTGKTLCFSKISDNNPTSARVLN